MPYEAETVPFIDIDNDGKHDEIIYDTQTFLNAVMLETPDEEATEIKAKDLMDLYFSRFDTDKSGGIEEDEWQKHYIKFAKNKLNLPKKNANNDYYAKP